MMPTQITVWVYWSTRRSFFVWHQTKPIYFTRNHWLSHWHWKANVSFHCKTNRIEIKSNRPVFFLFFEINLKVFFKLLNRWWWLTAMINGYEFALVDENFFQRQKKKTRKTPCNSIIALVIHNLFNSRIIKLDGIWEVEWINWKLWLHLINFMYIYLRVGGRIHRAPIKTRYKIRFASMVHTRFTHTLTCLDITCLLLFTIFVSVFSHLCTKKLLNAHLISHNISINQDLWNKKAENAIKIEIKI